MRTRSQEDEDDDEDDDDDDDDDEDDSDGDGDDDDEEEEERDEEDDDEEEFSEDNAAGEHIATDATNLLLRASHAANHDSLETKWLLTLHGSELFQERRCGVTS